MQVALQYQIICLQRQWQVKPELCLYAEGWLVVEVMWQRTQWTVPQWSSRSHGKARYGLLKERGTSRNYTVALSYRKISITHDEYVIETLVIYYIQYILAYSHDFLAHAHVKSLTENHFFSTFNSYLLHSFHASLSHLYLPHPLSSIPFSPLLSVISSSLSPFFPSSLLHENFV